MWDADASLQEDRKKARILKKLLIAILIILITGYLGLPWVFKYSSTVKRNLAFLNLLKNPFHRSSFHSPAQNYGLVGARNFYLTTPDGATLGVWHSLPLELQLEAASLDTNDPYNATVATRYHEWMQDATVFIYFHGAAGSRSSSGRVNLYKRLNSMGYHVVTFDYRGFGDSTGHPTCEQDLAMDARTILNWVREHIKTGNIFLWGHSLGSGVVSNLLAHVEQEHDSAIVGAVLESSFNNLLDALRSYPPSKPYSSLPGFDFFAVNPITDIGLTFRSEEYLKNVTVPLLFLHAEDDKVVPFRLGRKLYEAVISSRKDPSTVLFVKYNNSLGYGHMRIFEDPYLGDIVTDFVDKWVERKRYYM